MRSMSMRSEPLPEAPSSRSSLSWKLRNCRDCWQHSMVQETARGHQFRRRAQPAISIYTRATFSFARVASNSGGHRVPTIASVTGSVPRQQIVLPCALAALEVPRRGPLLTQSGMIRMLRTRHDQLSCLQLCTFCAHFPVQEVSVLWVGKFHIALVFERWNVEHRTREDGWQHTFSPRVSLPVRPLHHFA